MTLDRFDQILKDIYLPRLAAQLDAEGRGVAYFERLYALPDPADGVIDVHLDDEGLTRVGELRRFTGPGGFGWWQAWADDVPGAPIARSDHWDVAADALLAWPGLGAFQKAVTVELAAAERDLAAELRRQVFGPIDLEEHPAWITTNEAAPITEEALIAAARGYHPCTHCGDPACSYDDDC